MTQKASNPESVAQMASAYSRFEAL